MFSIRARKSQSDSMQKVVAVIGLGAFGRRVCEVLSEKGASVIAVDNQSALVDRVKDHVTQAVLLDATDEDSLKEAPLESVDVAVVAMGDSVEASILTTALLKRLAVPYVIARAISDLHHQVLRQVGADEIVNVEIAEGGRVAQRLIAPDILDRIPVSEGVSVAELYVPSGMVGSSLAGLELRRKYNINVVSIKRTVLAVDELGNPVREESVIFPEPSEQLQEDDILMVVGYDEQIDRFGKGE